MTHTHTLNIPLEINGFTAKDKAALTATELRIALLQFVEGANDDLILKAAGVPVSTYGDTERGSQQAPASKPPKLTRYTFDLTMYATLTIPAESENAARAFVKAHVDGASCNCGADLLGDPLITEVFLDESPFDLMEINGEAV